MEPVRNDDLNPRRRSRKPLRYPPIIQADIFLRYLPTPTAKGTAKIRYPIIQAAIVNVPSYSQLETTPRIRTANRKRERYIRSGSCKTRDRLLTIDPRRTIAEIAKASAPDEFSQSRLGHAETNRDLCERKIGSQKRANFRDPVGELVVLLPFGPAARHETGEHDVATERGAGGWLHHATFSDCMKARTRSINGRLGMRPRRRSPTKFGSLTAARPNALAVTPDREQNASISASRLSIDGCRLMILGNIGLFLFCQ